MKLKALHYLAILKGDLSNNDLIEKTMREVLEKFNIPIVGKASHVFSPQGLTVSFLLAESHFYIHTYPEYNIAFCDCFTCGGQEPGVIVKEFSKRLNLAVEEAQDMERHLSLTKKN